MKRKWIFAVLALMIALFIAGVAIYAQQQAKAKAEDERVHNWKDASCTLPKRCLICGKTQGEPTGHTWQEANCIRPEHCIFCKETRGAAKGHTWEAASCTTPKTCSRCLITEGDTLPHAPGNQGICTICGTKP